MRGEQDSQIGLLTVTSPGKRVPAAHPIREIKRLADEALRQLDRTFDEMYSAIGRPSIPPERLLKGQLLIALCLQARSRLPLGGALTLRARSVVFDEAYAAQRSGARLGTHLQVDVESRAARPLAPASVPADGGGECPPALLAALERQGGFFAARQIDADTVSLRICLPAAALTEAGAAAPVETCA